MAMSVHCDIVSAEGEIFSGLVELLVAPAAQGEIGILPNHAPLLTTIDAGPIKIVRQGGTEEVMYVSGGFLEVQPDTITVLADTITRGEELDEAAIEKAREQAKKALLEGSPDDTDYEMAAARLAEAMAQLRVLSQIRKYKK
ncbi:F0F1 ATP synthase subunit epsilon [Natronospirillum operosum]|uniref:ATP synthase epsilon chain n=1 Tax=Natronospirillum operosum TaxID=2759953 RepID=A0A4Z0W5X9_9GAMM|nr:F0F1 ATP synthase subunit epsilon [Natronospirillum operosum]TGG91464.1 F0F1 ATP synthase subunit epsilon [Natronospirillum operosum]